MVTATETCSRPTCQLDYLHEHRPSPHPEVCPSCKAGQHQRCWRIRTLERRCDCALRGHAPVPR